MLWLSACCGDRVGTARGGLASALAGRAGRGYRRAPRGLLLWDLRHCATMYHHDRGMRGPAPNVSNKEDLNSVNSTAPAPPPNTSSFNARPFALRRYSPRMVVGLGFGLQLRPRGILG